MDFQQEVLRPFEARRDFEGAQNTPSRRRAVEGLQFGEGQLEVGLGLVDRIEGHDGATGVSRLGGPLETAGQGGSPLVKRWIEGIDEDRGLERREGLTGLEEFALRKARSRDQEGS